MPRYSHQRPELTAEDVERIVAESPDYNHGGLGVNRPPFYEGLAGQAFTIRYDEGRVLDYRFEDVHTLAWREPGEETWHEEYYEALTPDKDVVFFLHIIRGSKPQAARMVVVSTDTGRVTTFFVKIGNQYSAREVDREICFGYVDRGTPPQGEPHCLTEDLVGKSIIWSYTDDFVIQHIYASKWYSAFVDFYSPIGGMMLDSPCNYVKINDHVYIYSWIEIEGAGIQGFALMNLHEMHEVGCFFGINGAGKFECYTFGATGEYVGQLTNLNIPNDVRADLPWPPVRATEEEKR